MTTTPQESRRGSLDLPSAMLPQEPPPAVARVIAWLLIVVFGCVLLGAIFIRVPETVQCRFVLMPKDGADPVQAPYQGVISQVRVTEGAEVPAGTELFTLRSDEILKFRTELATLTEDLHARQENSARLEASYNAQAAIKASEIAQVEREVAFREKHAETYRGLVKRIEALAAKHSVSEIEAIQRQLDLAQSEKDLIVAQKSLEQTRFDKQRMETEHERQIAEQRTEVQKLNVRIATLQTQVPAAGGDLLSIRSPYDAVVISLPQRNAGAVVQAGQELCQLARVEATPRVRLILHEDGISRLLAAQQVRLFLDAFPYQRYGTVTARLDWVSPAVVTKPEGPRFVALASLDDAFIRTADGPRALRVGMMGEARILVGHRALVEYLFEPVRQLRENMRR